MDVRLTSEQRQLRDAAAKLADDLGPGSVAELDDAARLARLEKAVHTAGWRTLRSDGASGVEVALVAEEFGRGLVDVPFLGPVLADDLRGPADAGATIGLDGRAIDVAVPAGAYGERPGATGVAAPGGAGGELLGATSVAARDGARGEQPDRPAAAAGQRVLFLDDRQLLAAEVGERVSGADLTRHTAEITGGSEHLGELSPDQLTQWRALAVTTTTADLLGAARGAQDLAVEYARVREQYGHTIGSYQAVAHLLAESRALIEGSISVLRHAAWAVDELPPAEALRAARIAKVYTARAAHTVCETSIQVHGGIGNTWECLAHVFLRRALTSTELFAVRLEEIDHGLS
ncbi:acyl-CoA dehydrogenase family protein [Nocardia harenae]|uniref:acyl-CoA dehydrogenase family protein n=1 Tax=Nocardia harenae TaxID=358707 RepID=UPI00082D6140|nr:acyl-CoA dehydrogenase family protein [Nocardia harenae]